MAPNAAVALVAALLVVCAHAQPNTVHDQLNAVACGLTGLVGSPFRRACASAEQWLLVLVLYLSSVGWSELAPGKAYAACSRVPL